jgi:hypothetical protein
MRFIGLCMIGLLIFGCQQILSVPPNQQILAKLELPFGQALKSQAVAVNPDSDIGVTPSGLASVNSGSGGRYLSREFIITNNTASSLKNIVLVAYTQLGNEFGTAFKNMLNFGGVAVTNSIRENVSPAHGMTGNGVLLVDPLHADLSVLDETTVGDLQSRALLSSVLQSGEYLLNYGFLVQDRANSDGDNDLTTIGAGLSGQVTVSFKVPNTVSSAYNFKMTVVVTSGHANSVTQSLEEQAAQTYAGQSVVPSGYNTITLPGGYVFAVADFRPEVRFAGFVGGTGNNLPAYWIKEAKISQTISSNSDGGMGSLRQAIADAVIGDGLYLTNNVTLTSGELSIGDGTNPKNLTIYAAPNVQLSGNNSSRVFKVNPNTIVKVFAFTITNGRFVASGSSDEGGGGVFNNGHLTLTNMQVQDNSSQGYTQGNGTGYGGGIYNSGGTLIIQGGGVINNQVLGITQTNPAFPGIPYGAEGGSAFGGGIYNTNSLTLRNTLVTGNSAAAADGGSGAEGQETFNNEFVCITPNGNGGNGGNASGGGVFSTTPFSDSSLPTGNTIAAGAGGVGGSQTSSCVPGANGSSGMADSNNKEVNQ